MSITTTSNTVDLTIGGQTVTVPVKFTAGMTLTEAQAKVIDAAYNRQFINNQNALWKALEDKKAKGETVTFPTAAEIAARYTDYEPQVGGGPRLGSLERMKLDAAWRAWVGMVAEHNESVSKGGEPVIVKAGTKQVKVMRKADADKDETAEAFAERKANFCNAILASAGMAERVQIALEAIQAERGKDSAKAEDTVTSGADLL